MDSQLGKSDKIQKSILAKMSVVISLSGFVLFIIVLVSALFSYAFLTDFFVRIAFVIGILAGFCCLAGFFLGISAFIAILIKRELRGGYMALLGVFISLLNYVAYCVFLAWLHNIRFS